MDRYNCAENTLVPGRVTVVTRQSSYRLDTEMLDGKKFFPEMLQDVP